MRVRVALITLLAGAMFAIPAGAGAAVASDQPAGPVTVSVR
jgi:hypothetical protein